MKQGLPEVPTWQSWLKTVSNPIHAYMDLLDLYKELPSASRIGIDPTVIPYSEFKTLNTSLTTPPTISTLIPVTENLIDQIWGSSKPPRPSNEIFHLADQYTGEKLGQKLTSLREKLAKIGSPGIVISQLDEVAWLFNLRGSDIPYNPVSNIIGSPAF